ncbi:ribonuclease P protein component 1 [Halolamina sp. CBA1230]|uniref:ribonuclease P protein component 1 n=1 Tax=Halolamina sp. CBA1230 TaxID=1853690 RepID=UPI0009A1CDB4|nr:ribonuclease P protein component 1 [Halolamina sp. CBA1230]QKY19628.1 ribonuclease P protein component 1 [Halolamina sp. CBA1230]
MALTPDTLTRHELNGLPVRVADAANPDLVGISGRVVVETMKTFHVDDGRRVRQVPKEGSCFEFAIATADDAARASVAPAADEAADAAEASGSVSQLGTETAGVRPGKSGPSAPPRSQGRGASQRGGETSPQGTANHLDATGERSEPGAEDECQDTVYVTVDGERLLSRPAARTERGGDSTWQSD